MAIAIQSVTAPVWAGVNSFEDIVVAKPTGLAVGDLMIAHISQTFDESTTGNVDVPAGWTKLTTISSSASGQSVAIVIAYIVATATEVAASDFAFTNNNSSFSSFMGVALYRIDGQGHTSSMQFLGDPEGSTTTTPTFANSVTPVFPNSLVLFLTTAVANAVSGSTTDYAIANDNPSWTEQYDVYGNADGHFGAGNEDGLMAGASAVRPETTATGDSTCTFTNFADQSIGIILVIPPVTNVNQTPSVITATFTVQAPAVTANATVSPAVITATFTVQAPTTTITPPKWLNANKNTSLWLNQDRTP